jgi:hypothetical protein
MTRPLHFSGGRPAIRNALNRIVGDARSAHVVRRSDNVRSIVTPGGTAEIIEVVDRPVWLYGITLNELALVKDVHQRTSGAWSTTGTAYLRVPLAPNFTGDHFIFLAVGALDQQEPYEIPFEVPHSVKPTEFDMACELRGGYLYPAYRFRLVEPVSIDELCNPCEGKTPVESASPAGDCACGGK